MLSPRRPARSVPPSAFSGFRFPPDVIVLAVRWYLRFGLSYRDVEELLAVRCVDVDHVTVYRWVQRFTPTGTLLTSRALSQMPYESTQQSHGLNCRALGALVATPPEYGITSGPR